MNKSLIIKKYLLISLLLLGCRVKEPREEISLLVVKNGLLTFSTHEFGLNFETSTFANRQRVISTIISRINDNQHDLRSFYIESFDGLSVYKYSELNSATNLSTYLYFIEFNSKTTHNLLIKFADEKNRNKDSSSNDIRLLADNAISLLHDSQNISFYQPFYIPNGLFLFITSEGSENVYVRFIRKSTNEEIDNVINSIEYFLDRQSLSRQRFDQ